MNPTGVTTAPDQAEAGTVAFVGAGPGDENLLTLRGAKLLGGAGAVVLDRGAGRQFLRHCPEDVEIVDAAELNPEQRASAVVNAARSHDLVVRLCAGDPAVAGGLAEEAAACAKAGIAFEIVPGVPPATAVPAYAGIPLTTEKNREVRIVDATEPGVDWEAFAAGDATLVILGAGGSLTEIARSLVACGRPESTPVATTHLGTTTQQHTEVSTLGKVATVSRSGKAAAPETEPQAAAPDVTVVGEVAAMHDVLSWFETKPLFGWRILVPRTKEQSASLADQLRSYGATPELVPTISVEPPRTPQQMERAVKGLVTGRYEWVAFTSTNAVKAVREKFEEYGLDARAFAGVKIAAVGEQTAAAVRAFGVQPDLVPERQQSSEGLLEVWPPYDATLDPIDRVLLPRADIATETLVAGLKELGWEVDDVTAYRTVRAAPPPAPIREAIKGGGFDAVLFTSSSTVRNLVGIAGKPHATTVIAVIGPQTACTAEEHGLRVDVRAPKASASALVAALASYGAKRRLAAVEAGEAVLRPSQQRRGARRRAK